MRIRLIIGADFHLKSLPTRCFVYYRFALSLRDVEDLLVERGVAISYETVRVWCAHVGPEFASRLRKRQPLGGDQQLTAWPAATAPPGEQRRRVQPVAKLIEVLAARYGLDQRHQPR